VEHCGVTVKLGEVLVGTEVDRGCPATMGRPRGNKAEGTSFGNGLRGGAALVLARGGARPAALTARHDSKQLWREE
jgi:hypothetical protein